MSAGKLLAGFIVISAIFAGGLMYYLQVYGFYDRVDMRANGNEIVATTLFGATEIMPADGAQAIDADSSPIRYRACFQTPLSWGLITETFVSYEKPTPLNAPGWFDCFDAASIGADLEAGRALAVLGQENIIYGIDRVLAIYDDGRGYAWNQINHCGAEVFNGKPAPGDCPPAPIAAPKGN